MGSFRYAKYDDSGEAIGLDDPNQVKGSDKDVLTIPQVDALNNGDVVDEDGGLFAISELTPVTTLTATGTVVSGPGEYGGYYCTVAAGNITIYDNTSAAGTVIVPTTALTVGPFPWMGAGTTQRRLCSTGVHVVLSGAATVDILAN